MGHSQIIEDPLPIHGCGFHLVRVSGHSDPKSQPSECGVCDFQSDCQGVAHRNEVPAVRVVWYTECIHNI